jgi:hypothetical protein
MTLELSKLTAEYVGTRREEGGKTLECKDVSRSGRLIYRSTDGMRWGNVCVEQWNRWRKA